MFWSGFGLGRNVEEKVPKKGKQSWSSQFVKIGHKRSRRALVKVQTTKGEKACRRHPFSINYKLNFNLNAYDNLNESLAWCVMKLFTQTVPKPPKKSQKTAKRSTRQSCGRRKTKNVESDGNYVKENKSFCGRKKGSDMMQESLKGIHDEMGEKTRRIVWKSWENIEPAIIGMKHGKVIFNKISFIGWKESHVGGCWWKTRE